MNRSSILVAVGLVALLAASLFSYLRVEQIGGAGGATVRLSLDGAAMASVVLGIAIFLLCRRILKVVRVSLRQAGLPATTTHQGITRTFYFGMSPFKLSAFALVILVVWLLTLSRKLQDLSDHLQRNAAPTTVPRDHS